MKYIILWFDKREPDKIFAHHEGEFGQLSLYNTLEEAQERTIELQNETNNWPEIRKGKEPNIHYYTEKIATPLD